jgi:hypothetical protein
MRTGVKERDSNLAVLPTRYMALEALGKHDPARVAAPYSNLVRRRIR